MPHWLEAVIQLLQSDTANLKELARLVGADPRYFYRGVDPSKLDLSGQDIDGIEFCSPDEPLGAASSKLLLEDVLDKGRKIGRTKRSEERVALLLLLVFENPQLGRAVLSSISEKRSKSAAAAIEQLRLETQKTATTANLDQIALVRAVRRHYTHTFPDSRAALFYYLVKHLSDFPEIKRYLQSSWTKSYSYAFAPYSQEIGSRLKS